MKKKLIAVLCTLSMAVGSFGLNHCASAANADLQPKAAADIQLNLDDLLHMDELYGWATVNAEGLEGTTGGGNAVPQLATTLEELETLARGNTPRVIVIDGRIECGDYGITVGSNKTIVGLDENATVFGGFRLSNVNNVIISNLNVQGTWPESGPDDCLEIRGSHHLWLNHLNIWNSTDGNMDITMGSDYVTVSWCKFWYSPETHDGEGQEQDHRLSCLIGSGAGDHDDTDFDRLKVTYHHNWFADLVDQRMPRVMYGRCHIYNNYYSCEGNSYCIGADCYASLLIENNVFKNVNNPHMFTYGNGYPACIVARGNIYDNARGTKNEGQLERNNYVKPFETAPYDYWLNSAEDTPEIVEAFAGPQKMSDASAVPEKLANGALIEKVEEPKVLPSATPFPTKSTYKTENDNPITYDQDTDTYTYHGQNSHGVNAEYEIENPFKNLDLSEEWDASWGIPYWEKGVTISYWVNLPENAVDAAVLNFNLVDDRQIERSDKVKYDLCQAYSELDPSYSMGEQSVYVDENGKEYTILKEYGENVRYNPNYPTAGCYYADDEGGAYHVYLKGSDPAKEENWTYLNYIGDGMYEHYGTRFFEEGGENSLIREGDISGSFSIYASGSVGYRQDNWKGIQLNPHLYTYGSEFAAYTTNQFYYWGNGSDYTMAGSMLKTPVVKDKGQWHFVAVVIQNDWVQFFMDGMKLETYYLNYWDKPLEVNNAGDTFNLGYGHRMRYRLAWNPNPIYTKGKTIMDFITDENTVLTVGGLGSAASCLGQHTIGTPDGTMVKNLEFYDIPIDEQHIFKDKIDLNATVDPDPDDPSTKPPTAMTGDVNGDGRVDLDDAQQALLAALGIEKLSEQQVKAADVNGDGNVNLDDARAILNLALGINTTDTIND